MQDDLVEGYSYRTRAHQTEWKATCCLTGFLAKLEMICKHDEIHACLRARARCRLTQSPTDDEVAQVQCVLCSIVLVPQSEPSERQVESGYIIVASSTAPTCDFIWQSSTSFEA